MISPEAPTGVSCLIARVDAFDLKDLLRAERALHSEVRQRFTASGEATRRRMLAARSLAGRCIAYVCGQEEVPVYQRCSHCGSGAHGMPTALRDDVSVSWAHSEQFVAAAASTAYRVGVDVESVTSAAPSRGLILAALADSERSDKVEQEPLDFIRLWTVKESLVKLGLLVLDDFGSADAMIVARRHRVDVRSSALENASVVVTVAAAPRCVVQAGC